MVRVFTHTEGYHIYFISFLLFLKTLAEIFRIVSDNINNAVFCKNSIAWSWCCSIICFLCSVLSPLFVFFSSGHCVVCPSLIYSLWLSLWYLQAFSKYFFGCLQFSDFCFVFEILRSQGCIYFSYVCFTYHASYLKLG
jgi:hypothetical protein